MIEKQPDAFGHLEAFARSEQHAPRRDSYYAFLRESDVQLKVMIEYLRTQERPLKTPQGGSLEFGIVPYWVKNPPHATPGDLRKFLRALEKYHLVPPPTVTQEDYGVLQQHVEDGTAVAGDGTIFGKRTYEQLDPKWLGCLFNDLITHERGPHRFGTTPHVGNLGPGDIGADPVRIALVGDWGTGRGVAQKVIRQARQLTPHHIVHLGDVYYSGTPSKLLSPYYPFGESYENRHFVDLWPSDMLAGTSFTLNSNHEMYCGGQGYFQDALKHDGPFGHQDHTSYFLLQNEHWQLFGLDSAYASKTPLYMSGALNQKQIDFVRERRDPAKRCIVLTHHTGLNIEGTESEDLWNDIEKALAGDQPDYWYWGHAHNGVVYQGRDRQPAQRNRVEARCVGHGAIPFGFAWGLTKPGSGRGRVEPIETVKHFAHAQASGPGRKGQVLNGFALITLNGAEVSETFYDEDGRKAWPTES